MEHALVRRDVAMIDDPLRGQRTSLVAGSVLAAIAVAGCAAFGQLNPQGALGSAPIVMDRASGALYVRIGDTLHPVPNLASARLVARTSATPAPVSGSSIAAARRGPHLGISGAPATIGTPLVAQDWTVCDDDRTVVMAGDSPVDGFDAARSVLVTPAGESAATTYLLYDGRRARVDLRDAAVVRALRLDGIVPLSVSRALLDLVPEVPGIAPPVIEGAGAAGPSSLPGVAVGAVVRVLRAATAEYYVVLKDGVQPVGDVAADLVRFVHDRGVAEVATVGPAVIAGTPIVGTLPVGTFPQRARTPVGADADLVVCARWRHGRSGADANSSVLTGTSAELDDLSTVGLAQADGAGPNVDAVVVPPGRSLYVRSARLLGEDTAGPRFVVTDSGVVFGIRDDDAAQFLGFNGSPEAAPWPILAHLPHGPELSADAASVLRDGIAAPS